MKKIEGDNYELYFGNFIDLSDHVIGKCDLLATDPPYRLTSGGKSNRAYGGILSEESYDNKGGLFSVPTFDSWMPLVYNSLKEDSDVYIMCSDKKLHDLVTTMLSNDFSIHTYIIWDKSIKMMTRWYMKQYEFIIYGWKGKAKAINFKGSPNIICLKPKVGNRIHPTEKPVELMEYLILNSTQEGDVVLDPFMGSGTTGVAALKNNRKFIGFEIFRHFFEISVNRIEECVLECKK